MAIDRDEIRAWLEAECPPEMREPVRGDDDICWGGRRWVFPSAAQKAWFERCLARGFTVPTLAARIRRRRALSRDEAGVLQRGNAPHRRAAAADELRHLHARAGAARVRHGGAEGRASAAHRARRDPLVPGLFRARRRLRPRLAAAPRPRTRAIIISSTARRSGPPTPTRPTGSSAWCAPTATPRSSSAFRSC